MRKAFLSDIQPRFNMNSESYPDTFSDLNVGPTPSFKPMPNGRLQFENCSFISDSASDAGSLLLSREDYKNNSLKKPSPKKSSMLSHLKEIKNTESVLVSKPEDVWDYIKEQDEKLKLLQNQVSSFLLQEKTPSPMAGKNLLEIATQTSICISSEEQSHELIDSKLNHPSQNLTEHLPNPDVEVVESETAFETAKHNSREAQLCEDKDSKVEEHYLTLILRCLAEQNNQIRQLQGQVDLVVKRTAELESFHSKGPKENDHEFSSPAIHPIQNYESSPVDRIRNHRRRERKTPSPEFDSDQENRGNSKKKVSSPEFSHSSGKNTPDYKAKPCKERCTPQNLFPSSKKNRSLNKRSPLTSRSSVEESPDRSPEYDKYSARKDVHSFSSLSLYGLSPDKLSLDTKNYLEKHNLVKPLLDKRK